MRLYHVFADHPLDPGAVVVLGEEESRHLAQVRRVRESGEVLILNGRGVEARGVVVEAHPKRAAVRIVAIERSQARPSFELQLALAITRTDAFEEALHRAIELGITAFRPIDAGNTVVKLDEGKRRARLERWHRLACERLKQCERLWMPTIHEPAGLSEILGALDAEDVAPLALAERAVGVDDLWSTLESTCGRGICFLVGPEGGWNAAEAELIASFQSSRGNGIVRVTMGEAILRAETAAIAAVATALAHRLRVRDSENE